MMVFNLYFLSFNS